MCADQASESDTAHLPLPDNVAAETIGVVAETAPGERRVALAPSSVPALARAGLTVLVERGAGLAAGFDDQAYQQKGASLVSRREALQADVLLSVRASRFDLQDLEVLHPDQVVIGLCESLSNPASTGKVAERKAVLFALELMPRTTRAQSMDVLSSQATAAGYRAVLLAADALPKMFPLLTTAAGTLVPARVLVIGAGVAGLQAIATARRLGAVVEAYDVRPAVREEVESLGARFVELPLQPGDAQDASGYAKALGEQFYVRQRELLTQVVAGSDVVITTAMIPGKPAPVLVTREMVEAMAPGSVVVDIAAPQGGNCEVTRPDDVVEVGSVRVFGPTNPASAVAHDASLMYAKNVSTFLLHVVKDRRIGFDTGDEILAKTLVARDGEIVNPRVREALEDQEEVR
jgi:proton-translocating NAD(P)+ transhydrogenase subunit alpha